MSNPVIIDVDPRRKPRQRPASAGTNEYARSMKDLQKTYTRPYQSLLHQVKPKTGYGGYTIKLSDDKLKELFYRPEPERKPTVSERVIV